MEFKWGWGWTARVPSRLPHCWLQDGEAWQLCALSPYLGSGDNATSPPGSLCRVDNSRVHEVLVPLCAQSVGTRG